MSKKPAGWQPDDPGAVAFATMILCAWLVRQEIERADNPIPVIASLRAIPDSLRAQMRIEGMPRETLATLDWIIDRAGRAEPE